MQEASPRGGWEGVVPRGGWEGVILRGGLEGVVQNPLHFRINNSR